MVWEGGKEAPRTTGPGLARRQEIRGRKELSTQVLRTAFDQDYIPSLILHAKPAGRVAFDKNIPPPVSTVALVETTP